MEFDEDAMVQAVEAEFAFLGLCILAVITVLAGIGYGLFSFACYVAGF